MAKFFDALEQKHIEFIEAQQMFFVATAPKEGRINLSPKGLDSFRILSPTELCYLDFIGSGNETAAHLQHNDRITLMFNSFGRNALIMRVYGRGQCHVKGTDRFNELMPLFTEALGIRQIFTIKIDNLQTSCGYGVPVYEFVEERPTLHKANEKKGAEALTKYAEENNRFSIDGVPISN